LTDAVRQVQYDKIKNWLKFSQGEKFSQKFLSKEISQPKIKMFEKLLNG
jgi:hypothetical protein